MEEFVLDNPWAADIPKSRLLLDMMRYIKEPKSVEEIERQFKKLSDDDIAYALYVLKSIGVVEGDGEKVWLSKTGRTFIEEFDKTF